MARDTELGIRGMPPTMHKGEGSESLLNNGSVNSTTSYYLNVIKQNLAFISLGVCLVVILALSISLGTANSQNKASSTSQPAYSSISTAAMSGEYTGVSATDKVKADNTKYGEDVKTYQNSVFCEFALYGNMAYGMGWTCVDGAPATEICTGSNSNFGGIKCDEHGYIVSLSIDTDKAALATTIPTNIGFLSALTYLSLSSYPYYGDMKGPIPSTIGYLTNLQYLFLSRNYLTDSIPTEIGYLTNLISLGLHRNKLSGSLPTEFGNLKSLEALSVSNNALTGALPTTLGNLDSVENFQAWGNKFSGTIPTEIGGMLSLQVLTLGQAAYTGSIPSTICQAKSLTNVNIQLKNQGGNNNNNNNNNNGAISCFPNCLANIPVLWLGGQAMPCSDLGVDYIGNGNGQGQK